jgi:hypothetical protein
MKICSRATRARSIIISLVKSFSPNVRLRNRLMRINSAEDAFLLPSQIAYKARRITELMRHSQGTDASNFDFKFDKLAKFLFILAQDETEMERESESDEPSPFCHRKIEFHKSKSHSVYLTYFTRTLRKIPFR